MRCSPIVPGASQLVMFWVYTYVYVQCTYYIYVHAYAHVHVVPICGLILVHSYDVCTADNVSYLWMVYSMHRCHSHLVHVLVFSVGLCGVCCLWTPSLKFAFCEFVMEHTEILVFVRPCLVSVCEPLLWVCREAV